MEKFAKIIMDEPAQEDAFSGKGHHRTAKALANTIEELTDEDGAIGLEGAWGSGKSTVINLAEKILEKNSQQKGAELKYLFFEFDLWRHQTDRFKRAFLIELVDFLKNNGLDKDKADNFSEKVRNRKQVTTKINSKRFSKPAISLLLLLPLYPISLFLAKGSFSNNYSPLFKLWDWDLLLSVSMLILIMPYIIFSVSYFANKFKKEDNPASRALSFFLRESEEDTSEQYIRDEDPTTDEFARFFNEILEVFYKSDSRSLVMILDNIDRMPDGTVSDIWAELRTFLTRNNGGKTDSTPITVIVPYDRDHILTTISGKNEKKTDNTKPVLQNNDILSKTFHTTLRVAPPILSDTKLFFERSMERSFDRLIKSEKQSILYNLFHHIMLEDRARETPRSIVSFVNEIAVLWNQWSEIIPVEVMGLYILKRSEIESNPKILQSKKYIDSFIERQFRGVDEWQKFMASLYYNVEPELAYQVLLGEDIERALQSHDKNSLAQLAESPGFVQELNRVLHDKSLEWIKSDPFVVPKALRRILEVDYAVGREKLDAVTVITDNVEALPDYEDLHSEIPYIEGFLLPVETLGSTDEKLLFTYLSGLTRWVEKSTKADKFPFERGMEIVKIFSKILEDSQSHLSDENVKKIKSQIRLQNDSDFRFGVAYGCDTLDNYDYKDFIQGMKPEEWNENFDNYVDNNVSYLPPILRQLVGNKGLVPKTMLIQKITQRLNTEKIPESSDVSALVESLCILSAEKNLASEISGICQNGTLLFHYKSVQEPDGHDAAAYIRWLLTRHYGKDVIAITVAPNHPTFGNNQAPLNSFNEANQASNVDENEVATYVSLINRYDVFEGIDDLGDIAITENDDHCFYSQAFKEAVRNNSYSRLNALTIARSYPAYKAVLGEDLSKYFLSYLSRWKHSFERQFGQKNILSVPTTFLDDISDLNNEDMNVIFNIAESYLTKLSDTEFKQSLIDDDENIRLLIDLQKLGKKTGVKSGQLREPIREISKSILSGEVATDGSENWHILPLVLPTRTRNTLANDILKDIENQGSYDPINIASFFDTILSDEFKLPLTENPDTTTQKIILPCLHSTSGDAVDFFLRYKSELLPAYRKSDNAAKQEVKDAISFDNEHHAEIAKTLGIKKRILSSNAV